ncbi:MAG: hypothetical protein Kow0062_19050 [Acidobacteriota bacterium]
MHPVRAVVYGVTDPGQALEAAALGADGIAVAVGECGPLAVGPERASEIVAGLPPLVARLAVLEAGAPLPPGFGVAVVPPDAPVPDGAAAAIVRTGQRPGPPPELPPGAGALWVEPKPRGSSSATRFDYRLLERWGRHAPVLLEIPEGASGVEVALRLARPAGVVFGEGVWLGPGIVDLEQLERALEVVDRIARRLAAGGA